MRTVAEAKKKTSKVKRKATPREKRRLEHQLAISVIEGATRSLHGVRQAIDGLCVDADTVVAWPEDRVATVGRCVLSVMQHVGYLERLIGDYHDQVNRLFDPAYARAEGGAA